MNAKTIIILDELKKAGLITKDEDLTGGQKTSWIFDYMVQNYSYLLKNDIDIALPKTNLKMLKGDIINEVIMKFGKYTLSNPQIFEDRNKLLEGDSETFFNNNNLHFEDVKLPDEPVIFVANHSFKDDVLATTLAAKRKAYILFGSLPHFFNTIDGLLAAQNGVILVNRKVAESRKASTLKCKYVLDNGISLIVFPEGVWNKKPNACMLDFWSGFYRVAKKEDETFYPVVPIIHYIRNTHKPGKNNPIHTVLDDPMYLDGTDEKEGIEIVRTRMLTWYYKLLENYGQSTREELLNGYQDATEAWEDELRKRVATATRYDYEIEISADRRRKDEPLSIWTPFSELEVTKENAVEVTKAKQLVKELKRNDFQHRF